MLKVNYYYKDYHDTNAVTNVMCYDKMQQEVESLLAEDERKVQALEQELNKLQESYNTKLMNPKILQLMIESLIKDQVAECKTQKQDTKDITCNNAVKQNYLKNTVKCLPQCWASRMPVPLKL